jgi:DnaJ-class molecular chaperone
VSDVNISLQDALLGGSVTVQTIHGAVEMKVPPGCQSGEMKRLKGKGIQSQHQSKVGDHLVRLVVSIPLYYSYIFII